MTDTTEGLLAWQRRLYPDNHADRRNLALHLATQPVFAAAFVTLFVGPVVGPWWLALAALAAMVAAVAIQGRGHALESVAPQPFRGPLDVALRILAEQLVTFPRYVLSGDLARAWRAAGVDARRVTRPA